MSKAADATLGGAGWICENHPKLPFDHDRAGCDGAGDSCPACNRLSSRPDVSGVMKDTGMVLAMKRPRPKR